MTRSVSVFAMVFLCVARVSAFSVSLTTVTKKPIQWAMENPTYYLDQNGAPEIGSEALPAMRAAVATWNAVSCTSLTMVDGGTQSGVLPTFVSNTQRGDETNIFAWVDGQYWTLGSLVLAVTTPIYDINSGAIVDADIAFNGYTQRWSTDSRGGTVDVQSVLTHELGHFFGLQHVLPSTDEPNPLPTMAPRMDSNLGNRTLKPDDIKGVCYLYPQTAYRCADTVDCPYILDANSAGTEFYIGRVSCAGDTCAGITGLGDHLGTLGSFCGAATDCKSSLACASLNGTGYCVESCNDNDPVACPTDYLCTAVSDLDNTVEKGCLKRALVTGCACNTTSACQQGCTCDPDCDHGGCSTDANSSNRGLAMVAVVVAVLLILQRRIQRTSSKDRCSL